MSLGLTTFTSTAVNLIPMQIYISKNGEQHGPYTVEDLDQLLQQESITGDDHFWHEGREGWAPLSQFPGFAPPPSRATPPPPPPMNAQAAPTKAQQSKKAHVGKIVGFTVFFIVILVCGKMVVSALQEMSTLPPPPAPPVAEIPWSKVDEIYSLKSNATKLQKDQAWPSFQGKRVSWSGTVTSVGESLGSLIMQVKMNHDTLTSDVAVTLKGSEKTKASSLSKGDTVTFTGTLESWGTLLPIAMKDGEITGHAEVTSIESVKKVALGVWTGREGDLCLRMVFKEGGTCEEYTSLISADGWGEPKHATWEAVAGKYADSGKPYYGLHLSAGGDAIVETSTQMRIPILHVTLAKGDSFPFSK